MNKIQRKRKKLVQNVGEKQVEAQLNLLGVEYEFEPHSFKYNVPSTYTPDFKVKGPKGDIYIEVKGYHAGLGAWCNKIVHFIEANPNIDFRIIFLDASKKFNKRYKSNLGDWASRKNIKWSDKGIIPKGWIR